jgi:gamma-glutamylcyclotransferase (GGCT)/AIG2-like uncharacterized protein YtfP
VVDCLFVYGTLRGAFDNPWARKLRAEAAFGGSATVRGSIFRIAHYPGFREIPDGEVQGELWRMTDPAGTLTGLDDYEGPEYERVLVRVSTGETAWIYRYSSPRAPATRIASGDFCAP